MLADSNIHYFLVRHTIITVKYFIIYALIICIVFVPLSDTLHEDRHAFLNFSRAKFSKCLLERKSIYLKLTRKVSFTFTRIHYCKGSSVGIVTDNGLDGPGSNPGGNEIFCPSRPALRPTQTPVKWVLGLSRG